MCRVARSPEQTRALRERCGVDVPGVYFGQQSHSDLPGFCEAMRELRRPNKPHLTSVMTFAPLFLGAADALAALQTAPVAPTPAAPDDTEPDAEADPAAEAAAAAKVDRPAEPEPVWSTVSLCVLHDLSSERDLEQHVKGFFEAAQPGALLLVQCDPRAASLRRIEHAKYVCEAGLAEFMATHDGFFDDDSAESLDPALEEPSPEGSVAMPGAAEKKKKTKSLDVIVLVHLPRGMADLDFCVDFDSRWAYAFVDSVLPASSHGLLDVEQMMRSSMVRS